MLLDLLLEILKRLNDLGISGFELMSLNSSESDRSRNFPPLAFPRDLHRG
jgi:hypothetical protein